MGDANSILKFLAELEVATPVDIAVILDWMSSEVEEGNRRASISGATPFGRLKQLHNTPCRVLALVGMQNDNFPSRTTSPSWDLLRAQPKIWDRNARVDDRQMFLDAVLAPTERLIITASTQNIRTNKKQPFSKSPWAWVPLDLLKKSTSPKNPNRHFGLARLAHSL